MMRGFPRAGRPIGRAAPVLLALMVMVMVPAYAAAAQLYQWRDATGVVHYTDNPDAVPAQYRNQSQREVAPLAGTGSAPDLHSADAGTGKKIWDTKCQACHVYDRDGRIQGEPVGLFSFIVNKQTKFPYAIDTIVASFHKAVHGGYEDMPVVAVSDEDLKALAQFLINEVSKP